MELFYRKYGKGKALIILHGLFGMSDNWVNIAKQLSEKYEIYLPDLRNHGLSPHSESIDFKVMSEDIDEFIDKHKIDNPIIAGHSLGGKVAMKYSLENQNKINKLIVIDISPGLYSEELQHLHLIEVMQSIELENAKSYSDVDKYLTERHIQLRIRQFLLKNIIRKEDNKLNWKFNLEALKKNIDKFRDSIVDSSVFNKPALFIKGEKSEYIKEKDLEEIKTIFPLSNIKTIPNAGHWVHYDNPKSFLIILRDFLEN